jgi:nitrogen fixation/metabolism regulation signal transduction histidine kinase
MGFDWRFALGLGTRVALLIVALIGLIAALAAPGYGAVRVVAGLLVIAAIAMIWNHASRSATATARFVEALQFGDLSSRTEERAGRFGELARAFNGVIARLRAERDRDRAATRFNEALLDDMPVALLVIDGDTVTPANKLARQLFRAELHGVAAGGYAAYGATFAKHLVDPDVAGEETLLLRFDGRAQQAIVRTSSVDRLGARVRAVTVQPVQTAFDTIEMTAQTDLVRVLTHEILNSLTPIGSLAETAVRLLDETGETADARVADAAMAVRTLARRTAGLERFIDSYRAVARPPELDRQRFLARPWLDELLRLIEPVRGSVTLESSVAPEGLALDADPDLLAQAVINLLHNAVEAARTGSDHPAVSVTIDASGGTTAIAVCDNGAGVPEHLRRDVFLPFFTTRKGGTGVGLNLSRQIAIAHGGSIQVGDNAPSGAVFRISL